MCTEVIFLCGIAGFLSFKEDMRGFADRLTAMQSTLERRGPDQKGQYLDERIGLAHRRLAVIDVENGRQPMTYGRYTIVYNGELYNTAELRYMLRESGQTFYTTSDTEVILKAYVEWQGDCLYMLNGIFAFAIWDNYTKRLFLARDRMGVKPLFFSYKDGVFTFGSEIKTLLASGFVKPVIDTNGVAELMLVGPGRSGGSGVFRDIEEVKPGYCLEMSEDGMLTKRYWKLLDGTHSETAEETAEHVKYLVTDSIKRQLVSDVPIGTFLSGGLDSSIISSVASREIQNIKTFSVTYKDQKEHFKAGKFQPTTDDDFIGIMQNYIGADCKVITLDTPALVDGLYEAAEARDLPGMADVDSSLLQFCKEIKKDVTVALSGECADEIFGGYPWYRDKEIRERYGFPWAQTTDYRAGFISDEFKINAAEYVAAKYESTISDTDKMDGLSPLESRMKEMMRLNIDWFMQTLLDRKDRMSMYSGLEVRVPFCDHRIVEYLYTVPWEIKEHMGREKGILREAMKDYLPDEVLYRKKSPYPKTHNPSYRAAVSERLSQLLSKKDARIFDIVKREAIEKLLTDDTLTPWYGQLMTTPQTMAYMLQLEHFLNVYNVQIIK